MVIDKVKVISEQLRARFRGQDSIDKGKVVSFAGEAICFPRRRKMIKKGAEHGEFL